MFLKSVKPTNTSQSSYVTCYHKMSVKSPDYLQRYSLLNMSQNNRKQKKINTKYWFLLDKTSSYTHISYIILKLSLWGIWICDNFEKQLLLLYADFVTAGHIYPVMSTKCYNGNVNWRRIQFLTIRMSLKPLSWILWFCYTSQKLKRDSL